MGNCIFGGMGNGEVLETIQVVTANGGIMEFHPPVTVGVILEEFPCHAIFNSDDLFWKPLSNNEELCCGLSYFLLPLHTTNSNSNTRDDAFEFEAKVGHVRSKSIPTTATAPYRMSFDHRRQQRNVLKRSNTDIFSRRSRNRGTGVWKVNLAIRSEQLLEILSQDGRTQELIESVRTVVKCGTGNSSSGNLSFSDEWSISSSTSRASSKKE